MILSTFIMPYAADLRKQRPAYPVVSPARTKFVINVSAHIMGWVYLRAFSAVFDCFRWQLASTEEGIETTTFITLGHGTSLFGIVKLIWISSGQDGIVTLISLSACRGSIPPIWPAITQPKLCLPAIV